MAEVRSLRRGQVTDFIDRHNTAWEIAMASLAVVYLGVGFSIDEGRGAPTIIIGVLAALQARLRADTGISSGGPPVSPEVRRCLTMLTSWDVALRSELATTS